MRIRGIIKIMTILILDATAAYVVAGPEVALILTAGILLYAALGEYVDILKDGAIRMEKLTACQRIRLQEAKASLAQDVRDTMGMDISRIRFHMLPDSNTINAYAYGFRNIAITKEALDVTDNLTLNAVLGHEISHVVSLDAVFNRVIFANMAVVLASMGLGCTMFAITVWIMLAIPSLFSRHGCIGTMAASGITRLLKGITSCLQHILVAAYQAAMGVISRGAEYRADAFSAELGYSNQLAYFLERFIAPQDDGKVTLRELLYSTHPHPYKRIQRLQQHDQTQLQKIN